MMAAEGGNVVVIRYIYRGEVGEVIPREATHVIVAKDVTIILEGAFKGHRNIVEVICHDNVEIVEEGAFNNCPSLRRVIMPGVKSVKRYAFGVSDALTDVECGKLEIIEEQAFGGCESLRNINLSSAEIIEAEAFAGCKALADAEFGNRLETFYVCAFSDCTSLERITIPLKDGIIFPDYIFQGCVALNHVDLVEGELHETVAALQLENWRNDMNTEIDSINRILPYVPAGEYNIYAEEEDYGDPGEKARAIRRWIRSVLHKIIHYQAEHQRLLGEEASTTLQLVLPQDIVFNNILPFLELPSHTFEVEEDEDEDENEASEESSSEGEESEEELG